MQQRSRRNLPQNSKQGALAQLRAIKSGDAKRSEQFELKEEGDIYEDVNEDEYQEIVKKRREDEFIEDDDGAGYVDFGQEDWDDEAYSGDEADPNKRAKTAGARSSGVFNNLQVKRKNKATDRVSNMFLGGGGRDGTIGPSSSGKAKVSQDASGDSLLDGLLDELKADPMGISAAPARKRTFAGAMAHRAALPSYRPNQGGSTYSAPPPSNDDYTRPVPRLSINDLCEEADDVEAPGAESEAQFAEDEPPQQPDAPPMARAERGAAAATSAAEPLEEDEAQPTAVPFVQPVEQRGGLDWFQVCETDQGAEAEPPAAPPVTGGKDGVPALEEDGSLHLYWLDAFEDPYNAPGTVYLFGKVRSDDATGYSSCAVVLKGLERNVFVLPRERHLVDGKEEGDEVSFVQVYQEIQQVCRAHKITRFGCKRVERAYAFEEPGVPFHADWLKLVYSAEMAALPTDLEGKTFSKIFGAKTSCLERLLLKRKIMGPCWLKLDGVAAISSSPTTWCKFEVGLANKKAVSVLPAAGAPPPPPLVVASLHVQTVQNAKNQPEVVLASVISHKHVSVDGATANQQALQSFSVVRKLEQRAWPWDLQRTVAANSRLKLEICPSERALLNFLIAKLHNLDADVLVGHNIAAYDMGVLLQRIQACKIMNWSKIGRMRMRTMPKLNGGTSAFSGNTFAQWSVVAGRLMCDTFLSAQELLPSQRSYALKELAYSHLHTTKVDVDQSQVAAKFEETQSLLEVVRSCENDAFLSLQLMFKMMVLPLTKQLTNLAGNLWCKSLQGKRAERIEFLLLHEFHRLKYVVPDKETFASREAKKEKKRDAERAAAEEEGVAYVEEEDDDLGARRTGTGATGRKKAAYAGGLVLEPKRGFYDRFVPLLAFNSPRAPNPEP